MYCLLYIIVIHFQLVAEAATGATVAAAMSDQLKQMDPNMKNIGIILCGGNVEIYSLLWYTHG
jgi:serine racemase